MAISYQGNFQFNSNFKISKGAPIDERLVVDKIDDLINGSISAPYQGLVVYVVEEKQLYVLTTSLKKDSKKIENWKKIVCENNLIVESTDDVIRNYVSSDDIIEPDKIYSSVGFNSFGGEGLFEDDYIILRNGGDSYIKLYNNGENWIEMHIVDNSLGIKLNDVKIVDSGKERTYTNDEPIQKGVGVKFNTNLDFTGFEEERPNGEKYIFGTTGLTYEDVDIFYDNKVSDVYVKDKNGENIKILTENDKEEILNSIGDLIMVDPDGEGSENADTLQNVIISMNSAINKLDVIADFDRIDESEIDELFE